MTTLSLFEKATRRKLRIDTTRGLATVEDLWTFDLTDTGRGRLNLDDIGRAIRHSIKELESEGESLVNPDTKVEDNGLANLRLAFEVVKRIIEVKKADQDKAAKAAAKRAEIRELTSLLADAESAEKKQLTKDQLQKRLDTLMGEETESESEAG